MHTEICLLRGLQRGTSDVGTLGRREWVLEANDMFKIETQILSRAPSSSMGSYYYQYIEIWRRVG